MHQSSHPEAQHEARQLDPQQVRAKFVLAVLDPDTAARVQDLWVRLSAVGIRTPIDDGEPPHISLGGVELLRESEFLEGLGPHSTHLPYTFHFSHVGVFGNGSFYWLGIPSHAGLEALHRDVHELLVNSSPETPDIMYAPGRWVPHCTVARDVRPEQLAVLWDVMRTFDMGLPVSLSRFQLVDVSYPRINVPGGQV